MTGSLARSISVDDFLTPFVGLPFPLVALMSLVIEEFLLHSLESKAPSTPFPPSRINLRRWKCAAMHSEPERMKHTPKNTINATISAEAAKTHKIFLMSY